MIATHPHGLARFVLTLADDNMVLAQRLGELASRAPELEEDIAVANMALDHLGQARGLYTYAGELEGNGRDEDAFAMGRSEREFHNAVLVEQPNRDFAYVMARQLFVDAFQVPLYGALATAPDERLAGLAAKAHKEARYHLRHSSMWVVRLGDGTTESHRRMQAAVNALWQYTGDLFEVVNSTEELIGAGLAHDPVAVRSTFDQTVAAVLADATLSLPEDPFQRVGGRTGMHTEHLGHLLSEMQWLHRSNPGAMW